MAGENIFIKMEMSIKDNGPTAKSQVSGSIFKGITKIFLAYGVTIANFMVSIKFRIKMLTIKNTYQLNQL